MASQTLATKRRKTRRVSKVMLPGFRCDRCQHEWLPRDKSKDPLVCPKCKSAYWNTPRTRPQKVKS